MEHYTFRQLTPEDMEQIRELFASVFTAPPWNDDWSDETQLQNYLLDLTAQSNSLTFGLFDHQRLIGLSMGHVRHWYSGTEYYVDEFCIRKQQQGKGAGSWFLKQIEKAISQMGMTHIFLLTERDVPAYRFYRKNGFYLLEKNAAMAKKLQPEP